MLSSCDGDLKTTPRVETSSFVLALNPGRQESCLGDREYGLSSFNAECWNATTPRARERPSPHVDRIEKIDKASSAGRRPYLLTLGARSTRCPSMILLEEGSGLSPAQLAEITGDAPAAASSAEPERRISRFPLGAHHVPHVSEEDYGRALYLVFYKYYYKFKEFSP